MQSIFRYPGGKTKKSIRQWINANRPAGVAEYREPFVGGGGVFFGLESGPELFWLNDLNEGLMEVYRALADRPDEFIAICREIEPAREGEELAKHGPRGGIRYNKRLRTIFDEVRLNETCDQAFRYYFVNRTGFGGRVNYDIPSRLYFSNPDGWNVVETARLDQAATLLNGVRVTCGDYEPLFTEPGEGVWIYADPPYVVNGNLSPSSQLYQHSFDIKNHERLAKIVRDCQHNVCLSYDDDDDGIVRDLYRGLHILEAEWRYCGTTNEKKETGKELLILNYEPPRPLAGPTVFDPARVEDKMGADEAKECCERIRNRLVSVRADILDLYERCGWVVLGYESWAKCVVAEFSGQENYMYKQLKAGEVERAICTIVQNDSTQNTGALPEGWCREIARIDEDRWPEAWEAVQQETAKFAEPITAKLIRGVVERLDPSLQTTPTPPLTTLRKAWEKASEEERREFDEWRTSLA